MVLEKLATAGHAAALFPSMGGVAATGIPVSACPIMPIASWYTATVGALKTLLSRPCRIAAFGAIHAVRGNKLRKVRNLRRASAENSQSNCGEVQRQQLGRQLSDTFVPGDIPGRSLRRFDTAATHGICQARFIQP